MAISHLIAIAMTMQSPLQPALMVDQLVKKSEEAVLSGPATWKDVWELKRKLKDYGPRAAPYVYRRLKEGHVSFPELSDVLQTYGRTGLEYLFRYCVDRKLLRENEAMTDIVLFFPNKELVTGFLAEKLRSKLEIEQLIAMRMIACWVTLGMDQFSELNLGVAMAERLRIGSPRIAERAAVWIQGMPSALPALRDMLDKGVRPALACAALSRIPGKQAAEVLRNAAKSDRIEVRQQALRVLRVRSRA